MTADDPFFVVKGEVEKSIVTAKRYYERWSDLHSCIGTSRFNKDEYDWTKNELKKSVRSIDWDIEDLDETISIVMKNPKKFKMDESELRQRKLFIENTKAIIKEIKDRITNSNTSAINNDDSAKQMYTENAGKQYQRINNDINNSNNEYISDTLAEQQVIIDEQDDKLELIGGSVSVLKNMSRKIGGELDEHAVMLDDFGQEMDITDSKMDNVMKKMAKVMHMSNDKRQWCAILILIGMLLFIILLFFII